MVMVFAAIITAVMTDVFAVDIITTTDFIARVSGAIEDFVAGSAIATATLIGSTGLTVAISADSNAITDIGIDRD